MVPHSGSQYAGTEQSEAGKDVESDELPGLACSGTWDRPLYTVGILEDFLRNIPHG